MTALLEQWLREAGQLSSGPAVFTPFGGGVSSEIFKVTQKDRAFVVKRALSRLRVAGEWQADVSRNATEQAFYKAMAKPLSGSVPRVFFHDPERGYFTMEYLGEGWKNWKELLLQGVIEPEHGRLAGELLGKLHASTWRDAVLEKQFDTTANFRQLRTDPYLRTAAQRHPELAAILERGATDLESRRLCLVHGDFSPKNLLLHEHRLMLLDAEVAWFGDPAFDVSFLLTHLMLKGLLHAPRQTAWEQTALAAWEAYNRILGDRRLEDSHFETRCAFLLSALLLARVDGKSPVEYLPPAKQQTTRAFALKTLRHPASGMQGMLADWRADLIS